MVVRATSGQKRVDIRLGRGPQLLMRRSESAVQGAAYGAQSGLHSPENGLSRSIQCRKQGLAGPQPVRLLATIRAKATSSKSNEFCGTGVGRAQSGNTCSGPSVRTWTGPKSHPDRSRSGATANRFRTPSFVLTTRSRQLVRPLNATHLADCYGPKSRQCSGHRRDRNALSCPLSCNGRNHACRRTTAPGQGPSTYP